MPKKQNRKGTAGLLWRRQTVKQEWALLSEQEALMDMCRVAPLVDARTDGRCYCPGCDGRIISYPHAVPYRHGGTNDAINRAGLCTIHAQVLHDGQDLDLREFLQNWLRRWYREQEGLPGEVWEAMAHRDSNLIQAMKEADI